MDETQVLASLERAVGSVTLRKDGDVWTLWFGEEIPRMSIPAFKKILLELDGAQKVTVHKSRKKSVIRMRGVE